jgi:hypothetical protein
MGFEQYHEPANELSESIRTFARMIASLTEEAEAIGWYEQRISLEKDKVAKAIMQDAQKWGVQTFRSGSGISVQKKSDWKKIAAVILFQKSAITKNADDAEEASD